jgi:hypothetical protein
MCSVAERCCGIGVISVPPPIVNEWPEMNRRLSVAHAIIVPMPKRLDWIGNGRARAEQNALAGLRPSFLSGIRPLQILTSSKQQHPASSSAKREGALSPPDLEPGNKIGLRIYS